MKRILFVLSLTLLFGLSSCQSFETKRQLLGEWGYDNVTDGGREFYTAQHLTYQFLEDNVFVEGSSIFVYGVPMFTANQGHYKIMGRNIILKFDEGYQKALTFDSDGCLYNPDYPELKYTKK